MNPTKLFVAMMSALSVIGLILFAFPALANASSDFANALAGGLALMIAVGAVMLVNQFFFKNRNDKTQNRTKENPQ